MPMILERAAEALLLLHRKANIRQRDICADIWFEDEISASKWMCAVEADAFHSLNVFPPAAGASPIKSFDRYYVKIMDVTFRIRIGAPD